MVLVTAGAPGERTIGASAKVVSDSQSSESRSILDAGIALKIAEGSSEGLKKKEAQEQNLHDQILKNQQSNIGKANQY
jgi:hypothetical protein